MPTIPPADESAPVMLPVEPGKGHPPAGVNVFFRIAVGLVLSFVITIFALIAVLFGDPAAPVAKLLDQIGMSLIMGEMFAILIVGVFALTFDRTAHAANGQNEPQEN